MTFLDTKSHCVQGKCQRSADLTSFVSHLFFFCMNAYISLILGPCNSSATKFSFHFISFTLNVVSSFDPFVHAFSTQETFTSLYSSITAPVPCCLFFSGNTCGFQAGSPFSSLPICHFSLIVFKTFVLLLFILITWQVCLFDDL